MRLVDSTAALPLPEFNKTRPNKTQRKHLAQLVLIASPRRTQGNPPILTYYADNVAHNDSFDATQVYQPHSRRVPPLYAGGEQPLCGPGEGADKRSQSTKPAPPEGVARRWTIRFGTACGSDY